ncbi:MAG: hydantoinase/oxoprolinase family protein, partial [Pseudomonadota bacterium]
GPLREAFEDEYRKQFARAVPGMTIEVLNWSVRIASATNHPRNETANKDATGSVEPLRQTSILCDVSGQTRQANTYDRARLRPGQDVRGPALIIEPQTTTYVSADFAAEVAGDGTLILTRTEEAK